MQKDIKYFQKIIQDKRKNTYFRDFLKEIVSWYPFAFYKHDWLITSFPRSDRINSKIISPLEFEETRDDLIKKWIDYDWDLIKNFWDLYKSIPMYSLFQFKVENVDYTDNVYNSKSSYLSNGVIHDCENVLYSFYIKLSCTNIFNSFMVWDNCDNVFFGAWIIKSYNIFYSKNIYNSSNIWFSSNLTWCRECIFCDWLENASYCIANKKYKKEEYWEKKKEILSKKENFHNYYLKVKSEWLWPQSINIKWRFLPFCSDLENAFFSYNVHSWRNNILMWSKDWNKDFYDCFAWWSPKWDRYYGCCFIGTYSYDLYMCTNIDSSSNCYYSNWLTNCHFCIWCVWLKNKSYCILNKQYSKEEWEKIAIKIFTQMEQDWILWDFFPWKLNPFYFNDTVANLIWWFTKEEVVKDWYMRRDEKVKVDIPEWIEMIRNSFQQENPLSQASFSEEKKVARIRSLDDFQWYDEDWNWYLDPEILNVVIVDKKWNYYRVIKMEYDFLMKYGLPLPSIHWLDRIKIGFGI